MYTLYGLGTWTPVLLSAIEYVHLEPISKLPIANSTWSACPVALKSSLYYICAQSMIEGPQLYLVMISAPNIWGSIATAASVVRHYFSQHS